MKNSNTNISSTSKNILIMAAGTGGHVFPALAVARQLQAQGHVIHWLGTPTGMENRLLEKESSIPMHHVAMKGMRGNGLLRLLKTPFTLLGATLAAVKIIKKQKIDVVAGFGGYVAAPGGLAAKIAGVPLVIHEQNAIAGMTNSYLARIATSVLEAFPNTFLNKNVNQKKVTTVGNPIRLPIIELGQRTKEQLTATEVSENNHSISKQLNILVIGGSLGAQVLNENVPKALASLNISVNVLHQCGRGHLEATQSYYDNADISTQKSDDIHKAFMVTEFVEDMAAAYDKSDILICRAGASTVSEVAVAGVPAIFVPLPHAVDDHQTANAKFLSEHNASKLLPQSQLNPETLAQTIMMMADANTLQAMQLQTIAQGKPNATQLAVDAVLTVTQ